MKSFQQRTVGGDTARQVRNPGRVVVAGFVLVALLITGCVPREVGHTTGATGPRDVSPVADQSMVQAPVMRPGDAWVYYSAKGQDAMQTLREQVIRVLADGSYYLQVVPELGEERVIEFSSQGRLVAYAEGGMRNVVDNPMHRLSFPLFVDKTWSDNFSGQSMDGEVRRYASSYRVTGWEEVTVRAGTFHALVIHCEVRRDDGRTGEETFWYASAAKRIVLSRPDWKQGTEMLSLHLDSVPLK